MVIVKSQIHTKRVYETPTRDDGTRVLVDRLWPRGVSKEKARIDLWLKEVAPSDALRNWFGHREERWEEFNKKYRKELEGKKELIERLSTIKKKGTLTLLFAAKDIEKNNAVVLKNILRS